MRSRDGKAGQVFSIDFVVAVAVFVLCMAFISAFWQNAASSASHSVERSRLSSSALVATDALLSGPGEPADWEANPGAVRALGLARKGSPGEIDMAKLANFTALPNATVKSLLGLRSDYYLSVEGVESAESYSAGNASNAGGDSAGITRYAVLDGKMVRVVLVAHK